MKPAIGCTLNHLAFLPKDLEQKYDLDPNTLKHAQSYLEQEQELVAEQRELREKMAVLEQRLAVVRRQAADFQKHSYTIPDEAFEQAEAEYEAWRD